jgi:hypothetical protein
VTFLLFITAVFVVFGVAAWLDEHSAKKGK